MAFIRTLIKNWLLRNNAILSRPPGQFNIGAHKLEQARQRGLEIRAAVDGGAADGGWTRELKQIYPAAQVLCVEPRANVQDDLRRLAVELPGIRISDVLLGGRNADAVEFNEHGFQSSILKTGEGKSFGTTRKASMVALDDLIQRHSMPWPDLIKLDLQGAELEALRGAPESMARAKAILLEVSFIPLMEGGPLAADCFEFLKQRGFRCYDIFALWHRPLDGALAQGDFLFVPDSSLLVSDRRWNSQGTVA